MQKEPYIKKCILFSFIFLFMQCACMNPKSSITWLYSKRLRLSAQTYCLHTNRKTFIWPSGLLNFNGFLQKYCIAFFFFFFAVCQIMQTVCRLFGSNYYFFCFVFAENKKKYLHNTNWDCTQ